MSLVSPLVKSLVSPVVVSLLGGGAISAEAALDAALEAESTSGDFVAQPDLTDLTSIFQADGSGNPSVGDSIADATVLDTSQFGGKTAAAFIAGQEELVDNTNWALDSSVTVSGDTLTHDGVAGAAATQSNILDGSELYLVTFNVESIDTSVTLRVGNRAVTDVTISTTGLKSYCLRSEGGDDDDVRFYSDDPYVISSVSVKHLPGNHTTASGTGPTVLDTFDQTTAVLTDNGARGDELVDDADYVFSNVGSPAADGSISSGVISLTRDDGSNFNRATQSIATEVGKEYTFEFNNPGSVFINYRVGTSSLGSDITSSSVAGGGSYSEPFRAVSTTTYISFLAAIDNETSQASNISVSKVLTAFDGQSNRVTNGTFDADSDWGKGTGWTIGSGVASCDGTQTGNSNLSQAGILTSDQWYLVRFYISAYTAGTVRVLVGGSGNATDSFAATGWHEGYVRADGAGLFVQADLNFNGSIDNVSVQEVPASIARTLYVSTNGTDDKLTLPLPARRNLLTWTEDFDNAAWDKSGISASGTILTASGTTTADFRQDVTRSTNGETVTFSLEVRRISGLGTFQLILEEWDGGFLASSANTSFVLTDEFQRISVTRTGNQAGTYWRCLLRRANGGGASDGEQVEIRKPQLELGSTATDYQRITSDYLADTSITMAVRTSDAQGMLLPFGGSTYYVGRFQDGSTSTTLSANVGSPTIWVDGVVFTGTWDDLHAAIADGDWHVVTFATVDASSASEATPFYVSNANSNNVEGDIAAFSIYPDSTATQALAEAAAADAIKETGYALAA